MSKKTVLVLFGGRSNEYEVSLRTAASILQHIDREQFSPLPVGITKDGQWRLYYGNLEDLQNDRWQDNSTPAVLSPDRSTGGLITPSGKTLNIDVIFPAMHGQNCEDGAIQGLFELCGIPYVGSPIAASACGFDKILTHIISERYGIPMAKWVSAYREESFDAVLQRVEKGIGFPCFVKPVNSGSSVGCGKANDENELKSALETAFKEDRCALVEELVSAQEVECAVIGNLEPQAPTTGEIVTSGGFYDYNTKYKTDSAKLLIPANISQESAISVRSFALTIYRALGCRGLSRVDFFVKDDGTVLFNEINTMPGFTSISMYPKMMVASGLSYPDLITKLIELAFQQHELKNSRPE